jgi:hypothetical protein
MNLLIRITTPQAKRLLEEAGFKKVPNWITHIKATSTNAQKIGRKTDIIYLDAEKSPDKEAGFHLNQWVN